MPFQRHRVLNWLPAGILLALLDVIVFNVHGSDRPIGASSAYPYLSGLLGGLTEAP